MSDSYRLELIREGLSWSKSDFKKSIKGSLRVYRGEELLGTFSTMEHGIRFVHLKVGSYEMRHSRKGTGRRVKCLRPTDERVRSILIHDAASRRRTSLSGCIAPFFVGSEAHGPSSAEAMESLWTMLGGYDESGKKRVTLLVLTNPILGDERTKEQWIGEWAERKKHS